LVSTYDLVEIDVGCAMRLCRWLKSFLPTWKFHHKFSSRFSTFEKSWSRFSFKWIILKQEYDSSFWTI